MDGIDILDEIDFESSYDDICNSIDASAYVVLIDVENSICLNHIFRSFSALGIRPKIIMLSSILTWCGELSPRKLEDVNKEFCTRTPVHSALPMYSAENTLWKLAHESTSRGLIYIIEFGLL